MASAGMRTAECRPYEGAGAQCAPLRGMRGGLWNGWTMGDGFFAALRMTGVEASAGCRRPISMKGTGGRPYKR